MEIAPLHEREAKRIQALIRYHVLDTEAEKVFDDLTFLASFICETPIALISLIDNNRQWFKSKRGLSVDQTSRDIAFCSHVILQDEVMVVPDATKDQRFQDNPLVTQDPKIRFYAGIPLKSPDGLPIGTICALDKEPKVLSKGQEEALKILSQQVMAQMELRLILEKLEEAMTSKSESEENFISSIRVIAHDLRNPIGAMLGMVSLIGKDYDSLSAEHVKKVLRYLKQTSQSILLLLDNLVAWSTLSLTNSPLDYTEIDIESVISQVRQVVDTACYAKDVSLQIDIEGDASIEANSTMLFSIIQNILTNSLKFSKDKSTIKIKVITKEEYRIISITDSGLGMPQSLINKIMEDRDVKSLKGVSGERGSGIGLKLVREFVRRHHGYITISSMVDVGTTVNVYLPVIQNKKNGF